MSIMTFAGKERLAGSQRAEALLQLSWEAEYLGVGMMETLAKMCPEHADTATACANMEWFNVGYCRRFGQAAGMHVSVERAEKLWRAGAAISRGRGTFEKVARLMVLETPGANLLYTRLGKVAGTPEVKVLADDLYEHENAMTAWFKSEVDGNSDGGKRVFAYLERFGISRQDAVIPREGNLGGDEQKLVLAAFAGEDAASRAADALRKWEKDSEGINLDAISVLVKDKNGKLKERKVAAGPVRAMLQTGLKLTDQAMADVGPTLDAGVGVLAWDFQAELVANKLEELGGTSQIRSSAGVTADDELEDFAKAQSVEQG